MLLALLSEQGYSLLPIDAPNVYWPHSHALDMVDQREPWGVGTRSLGV
jgi:hypothetical protein